MVNNHFLIATILLLIFLSIPLLIYVYRSARGVTPYLYLNARLKAKEGKLLTKSQLEEMVTAQSFSEIPSLLEGTSYGSELQGFLVNNAESLDEVLKQHRMTLYRELLAMMPRHIQEPFSYLQQELEVQNLKSLLRTIHAQTPADQFPPPFTVTQEFREDKLIRMRESRTIAELIPLLEDTCYSPLGEVLPIYEQTGKLSILESLLDKITVLRTWKEVSSRKELSLIQNHFALKIDLTNLKVLLRAKKDRIGWDEIEHLLIPQGNLFHQAKAIFEEEDLRGFINALESMPFYSSLMESLPEYEKTGSLFALEKALDEFFLKKGWEIALKHPVGIGPLMGFLSLKEAEMRNIRAIAVSKEALLSQDEIRSLMVNI